MLIKFSPHPRRSIQQIVNIIWFQKWIIIIIKSLDLSNPTDENDTDLIRRRRLEHYANRLSPTTINQENNNDS
jgi:hypothetical protein